MNITNRIQRTIRVFSAAALSLVAITALTSSAQAEGRGQRPKPLHIHGYQAYTNLAFVEPANPTILQVRTSGEGGVSHLGKMRSWSTDQTGDLVTGEMKANYTFEDESGDQLQLSTLGSSAFQPDGRVTFEGEFTVVSGTGKFKHAHGSLRFEGWARVTDFATGAGIGFGTIDGTIQGTRIDEDAPFVTASRGNATFNGADFLFTGTGVATRTGRYDSTAYNTPGPFNGAFVGIVDGQFTLAWSTAEEWTSRNGDKIQWSGVEFVYLELLTLPDGSPAPDFSKPSTAEIFQVVEGGSGRFAEVQGVMLNQANFQPVSPTSIAAQLKGAGFLSRCDGW
jgi:hypothetical protein